MTAATPPDDLSGLAGQIVRDELGECVVRIEPLTGGYVARTYRLDLADRSVVIRLLHGVPEAFAADVAIGPLVAGTGIPVPDLLGHGERDGWHYAISAFAPGQNADRVTPGQASALIPALVGTMNAIHRVDVAGTSGFGWIGSGGAGRSASWREHIATTFDDVTPGYWRRWRDELAHSRLDQDRFGALHAVMLRLLDHCPEGRWLVHGDYGFGNVLVDEGRIAAVIDWSNARFGDFMWDVAWLRFWTTAEELTEPLRRLARPDGAAIPAFNERLACYQLVIGMDALRVFARQDNAEAYEWATRRVSGVLASLPSLPSLPPS